ncbi:MAG: hypothetical protein LBK60_11390 [Verrucomicrobiales bacterium]|nr:hypothetical protein [Verrucomicrobiales bacterium]
MIPATHGKQLWSGGPELTPQNGLILIMIILAGLLAIVGDRLVTDNDHLSLTLTLIALPNAIGVCLLGNRVMGIAFAALFWLAWSGCGSFLIFKHFIMPRLLRSRLRRMAEQEHEHSRILNEERRKFNDPRDNE